MSQERRREKEREPERLLPAVDHPAEKIYESPRTFVNELATERYDYADVWKELRRPDNRVIKGSEMPLKSILSDEGVVEGSQHWSKSLVRPWTGVTQSLSMSVTQLAPEGYGQQHGHQNEAMLYILEGEGYEVHDGEEYKWEAGNLVVIHGGCVHRHYSTDPENPCTGLIVKPKALLQFLHLLYQGTVEDSPSEPAKFEDWTPAGYSEQSLDWNDS